MKSGGQTDIQSRQFAAYFQVGPRQTAQMVNDVTMASNILQVTAETVAFSAGAAGTTGIVSFDKAPIFDAYGTRIGSVGATSFAWVTGTVLTAEVAYNEALTDTEMLAALSHNGMFAIDYVMGRLYYKKATAGTSDTCNYKTRQLNVEITATTVPIVTTGATPFLDSSVDNSAQTMKASAGILYYLQVTNPNATAMWLQIFNHATPTVGVTTPVLSLWVPALGAYDVPIVMQGVNFSTAITYAATTTSTGAGAPGSNLTLNAAYI